MAALGGISKIVDPQLLQYLGLGLMSSAKYGGNLGDGLMGAIQGYQQNRSSMLQQQEAKQHIALNNLMMQRQTGLMQDAGLIGPQQGQAGGPAPGAAPPQGVPAGVQMAPGAPVPQGAQPQIASLGPQTPAWMTPPSAADIGAMNIGGRTPKQNTAYDILTGKSPLEASQALLSAQKAAAAQQYGPAVAQLRGVVESDDPVRDIKASPVLQATWAHYAAARGLDPVADLKPANVRQVMGEVANQYATQLGMPTAAPPIPLQNRNLRYGGVGQFDITGKKVGDLEPEQTPTFTLMDKQNQQTGKIEKVPVQTGGYGMAGTGPGGSVVRLGGGLPGAASANRAGGAVPGAPQTVPSYDAGYKPPTTEDLKAAGLATVYSTGLKALQGLEQRGITLTPTARAIIVHASTTDESGLGSQLLSQEALAHKLSPQEQQYMAALMPVLQGAGHNLGAARLTTSQIRQLLESVVPVNPKNSEAMRTINANRQGYYVGMLGEAGSAIRTPLYQSTLGADYDRLSTQNAGGHPPAIEALLKKYGGSQ